MEDYKKTDEVFIKQMAVDKCRDLVISDNIRKELMVIERKAEKNWKRFDFLHGENVQKLFAEYLENENVERQEDKIRVNDKSSNRKIPQDAVKSSPVIPGTSSAIVGWRSSLRDYNLEIFGRLHISPKDTTITLAPDDLTYQKFIILG